MSGAPSPSPAARSSATGASAGVTAGAPPAAPPGAFLRSARPPPLPSSRGPGTGFVGGGVGGALGGIHALVVTNSTFDSNEAVGGSNDKNTNGDPGSDAGSGYGGAIEIDGGAALLGLSTTAIMSNLTITRN